MKVLVGVFFSVMLVLSIETANAALSLEPVTPDPTNPDTCIRSSDNLKLKLNESVFGVDCSRTTCIRFGTDGLALQKATCGTVGMTEGSNCTKIEDVSKSYPDCCPRLVCEN